MIGLDSSPSQYTAAAAISSGAISRPEGAYTAGTFVYQSSGCPCARCVYFSRGVSTLPMLR